MSEADLSPDELRDYATIDLTQASFGKGTQIKVQLKAAKKLRETKVEQFKAGHAYRVNDVADAAFFINEIGFHPTTALPMGFGFLCMPGEMKPACYELYKLGGEVFF